MRRRGSFECAFRWDLRWTRSLNWRRRETKYLNAYVVFPFTAFVGLNLFQSAFTSWCPNDDISSQGRVKAQSELTRKHIHFRRLVSALANSQLSFLPNYTTPLRLRRKTATSLV